MSLIKRAKNILENINCQNEIDDCWIEPIDVLLLQQFVKLGSFPKEKIKNKYYETMLKADCNGKTYTPIVEIKNRGVVESITNDLVKTILNVCANKEADFQKDLKEVLRYTISELLNNVADHSSSDGLAMAQYFPTKKNIQFCVIDNGNGFLHNIKSKFPDLKGESEAIQKAMQKGITASVNRTYGHERNAGYGLFVISHLINSLKGKATELLIASNDGAVVLCEGEESVFDLPLSVNGVLVAFTINQDALLSIDYDIDTIIRMAILPDDEEIEDIF